MTKSPVNETTQHAMHYNRSTPTRTNARSVPREDMDAIFKVCRTGDWSNVLTRVTQDHSIPLTHMVMDNHISTTIIHQAITCRKSSAAKRAELISTILLHTPEAAEIKNGYGSLPLHVICQRNIRCDAPTKERLVFELVEAFEEGLWTEGGVGKRTPLHIIFTDYMSLRLTRMMLEKGRKACFVRDKKGYLPAHVACSRHCSPEKLRMLLEINAGALTEKTFAGDTLLDLARSTATKSHPNYALMDEINKQLVQYTQHELTLTTPIQCQYTQDQKPRQNNMRQQHLYVSEEESAHRGRLDSNESTKSWATSDESSPMTPRCPSANGASNKRHPPPRPVKPNKARKMRREVHARPEYSTPPSHHSPAYSHNLPPYSDEPYPQQYYHHPMDDLHNHHHHQQQQQQHTPYHGQHSQVQYPSPMLQHPEQQQQPPPNHHVDLLLHFSRNSISDDSHAPHATAAVAVMTPTAPPQASPRHSDFYGGGNGYAQV